MPTWSFQFLNYIRVRNIYPHEPSPSILLKIGPWSDILCHVAVTASVFLTVSITTERFYAVCRPLQYQARVREKGHYCILLQYILPAAGAALVLNLPKVLDLSQEGVKDILLWNMMSYFSIVSNRSISLKEEENKEFRLKTV